MGLKPSIELHIGELILEGFPGIHQADLRLALQSELSRLLMEPGLPGLLRDRSQDRLDGGTLSLQPDANARATAVHLARAIHGRLTP